MTDLICRKTMMRCQTQGMCAPFGGCQPSVLADCKTTQSNSSAAQSPAGVDGLEVVAWQHWGDRTKLLCALGKERGIPGSYTDEFTQPLCRLSDAQAIIDGLRGELLDSSAERNSVQRERDAYKLLLDRECNDADSMLMTLGIEPDEIRTEGGFLMVAHIVSCISVQRDRQAQRIGELAELAAQASVNCKNTAYYLRKYRPDLADICSGWCVAIDSTLSAGKDSDQ